MEDVSEVEPAPQIATVRSIERAFEILDVLRRSRLPLRLSELSRATGMHLATTKRIVSILVRFGYVDHSRGAYSMGIGSVASAFSYLVFNPMLQAARPILEELVDSTELSATLSVCFRLEQVSVMQVDGSHPLRYRRPMGAPTPLFLGGARILAAMLDTEDLESLIGSIEEIRLADGSLVPIEEFRETLAVIRHQGYVCSHGQRFVGAASVAVPVVDASGKTVAALQLSGDEVEFKDGTMERCIIELKQASIALSERLP